MKFVYWHFLPRTKQGTLCYFCRPHKNFGLSEQDRTMACPETTWLSQKFPTDGDQTAREPAQPDQTQS